MGSNFFISRPENVGRQDFNSIHFVRLLLLNNSWLVLGCISVSNIPFSKFIVVRWGCSGTFFLELCFTYAAGEFLPGVAGKSRTRKKKKKKANKDRNLKDTKEIVIELGSYTPVTLTGDAASSR